MEINSAIGNHHDQATENSDPTLRITCLANELAKTWGVGQCQQPTQCEMTAKWLSETDDHLAEELQAQAGEQFGELKSLLSS